jgi:hypothetical protein
VLCSTSLGPNRTPGSWSRPSSSPRLTTSSPRETIARTSPCGFCETLPPADVIERYGDQDIGLADASNVVLAERHGTSSILTLDERHFRALQGSNGEPFHLLPADR